MRLVDDSGRLFGRVNLIDALVGVVLLLLIPLGYGAYGLFRQPTPRLISVEPSTIVSGKNTRVRVQGEYLRPVLRLNAGTQAAQLLIETPSTAEITLPELGPGSHDLVLFDEAREVARLANALTVETLRSRVKVYGTFGGLSAGRAEALTNELRSAQRTQQGIKVNVVYPSEPELFRPQDLTSAVPLAGKFRVPSELELDCIIVVAGKGGCRMGETDIVAGTEIPVTLPAGAVLFRVIADTPVVSSFVDVDARFFASPEASAIAKRGDADSAVRGVGSSWQATLLEVTITSATVTAALNIPMSPKNVVEFRTVQIPEQRRVLTARLRVPVQKTETGFQYNGESLKIGETFIFRTDRYVLPGVIVGTRLLGPDVAAEAKP